MIVAEIRLCYGEEFAHSVFRHENQHGSCMGETAMADDMPENLKAGDRVFEYSYTEQGLTLDRPIIADGRPGKLALWGQDGLGNTSVSFTDPLPLGVTWIGAEIRVAMPNAGSGRLQFFSVAATAGLPVNTFQVPDPNADFYDALQAGAGFSVLPFYADYWGGVWTNVTYSFGTGLSTLTGSFGTTISGLGVSMHVGDAVVPNLHQPAALHIVSGAINEPGDDTMQVVGDVTAFVAIGDQFRIHQAAGYDYNFDTVYMQDACDVGGRNLWSGYKRHIGSGSRAGEEPLMR